MWLLAIRRMMHCTPGIGCLQRRAARVVAGRSTRAEQVRLATCQLPRRQFPMGVLLMTLIIQPLVAAEPDGTTLHAWKLTLGSYYYGDYGGTDVNLRWQRHDTHAWLGLYSDHVFGTQTRAGIDTAVDLGHSLQLQPALQLATQGFVGGSLNLQVGDAWFGLIGIGRTNLKPYFNLNFDPNDALTLGVGHRADSGDLYTVFLVTDDRLHTRQHDWHFTARLPRNGRRLSLDLLRKSGLSDVGPISAWGCSITYDWPGWFVRLARDPYQNFSAVDAWRVAGGIRF
jgi:hypothetical protein